ncbi:MAG: DUF4384 domain-containing protein [Candidatus Cloacimonadales bacterium]|nr:DUF4384 domain-containing protein [Candidatus Cloacimonadales bacterium]
MKIIIMLFLMISSTLVANEILPQDLGDGWYEITTSVKIENITPEQAKQKAIERACQLAIEQFAGIEVSGRTTSIEAESNDRVTMEHFSKLSSQVSNGIILEKEILEETNSVSDGIVIKSVTLKVKVGKQHGEADPYFTLNASLNKSYYQNGEELFLQVTPSKDCYITILNIMSDENVATVFPNQYREDNFVKANQLFELPNAEDQKKGILFKVRILPGKVEDTEIIKVIATKEPVKLQINSDFNTAFEELQNWLVKIPRSEIEEIDLQYFIVK